MKVQQHHMRLIFTLLPLVVVALLLAFFFKGLFLNPHNIPSQLINKPAPELNIPTIHNAQIHFTNKQLQGHVSLLNVWASWCYACRAEHPVLMDIAASKVVPIYSIDYKDDWQQANNWLKNYGNPYQEVGFDKNGAAAINWGVYGTPETFVIDKQGIVRYKHTGPISPDTWKDKILPIVKKWQKA